MFVKTAMLDGETSLKTRTCAISASICQESQTPFVLDTVLQFGGAVECAFIDPNIYRFDARLWMKVDESGQPIGPVFSLNGDHLLQQTLRLTSAPQTVYALVVYTGNESKYGLNRGKPPSKLARVDRMVNWFTIVIFIVQLVIVASLGVAGDLINFKSSSEFRSIGSKTPVHDIWYLRQHSLKEWWEVLVIPVRFLLLCSTMIPISLKVTMDFIKLSYAFFVNHDEQLSHGEGENNAVVAKSTSLGEDLGQIQYVLTDKTGTLTENQMRFKQVLLPRSEQLFTDKDSVENGSFYEAVKAGDLDSIEFVKHCVVNSSAFPLDSDLEHKGAAPVYNSSSPDELALVEHAALLNFVLVRREENGLIHVRTHRGVRTFAVLEEFPFSSDRKRMSVMVRDGETDTVRLYTKGADDVIFPRLRPGQDAQIAACQNQLDATSNLGLRTLCFAYRDLSEAEVAKAHEDLRVARLQMQDRSAALGVVYDQIEQSMTLQGVTAIEDKLQEKAPETIAILRKAGIRFWMLTGDKSSTAQKVALSCSLTSAPAKTRVVVFESATLDGLSESLSQVREASEKSKFDQLELVLVLKGQSLSAMLKSKMIDSFLPFLLEAHAVICCRVTPSQKADLVRLVRHSKHTCVAIGDGGNDVAMIQAANVGVGLRGKEGLQASLASDYSVVKFGDLLRLVMIHGRLAYFRTSKAAQYSCYKSFFFCWLQILYGSVTMFSGATLFNSFAVTAYNAVFDWIWFLAGWRVLMRRNKI